MIKDRSADFCRAVFATKEKNVRRVLRTSDFSLTFPSSWIMRKERNMVYTVGEMARLLDVSASTLRYYDKEGPLPFVERSSGADAFCRNPFCRASQSIIPPIRLKKLIAVTGFAVRIWIWLLSQQKSVEFHARLIFYVWRIA